MSDVTITQATVSHGLSATTPDDPAAEIRPSHWNSVHAASVVLAAAVASALFSNANGISFGLSNDAITGSYTQSTHAHTNFSAGVSNGGNTAGDTGVTGTRLVFAGGNNVTLSQATNANGATISVVGANTAAQSNQTVGGYAVGNTTGESSSSTFDARTISFRGSDNVSIGFSNGSYVFKAGGGGANFSAGVSGGNTSGDTGITGTRLVFAGGNNVTLSQATDANGGTITVSAGNAGGGNFSAGVSGGNTAGDTGITGTRLVFAGGNNITVSQATDANGGSITISGPNTAAQSNQSEGFYAVGNTTQNSSTTLDARTVSFRGNQDITVGFSNGSVQLSVNVTGAQSNQSEGFYAVGNTTQNSSTTLDARTVSFRGNQDITVGFSNGSVQLSVNVTGAQSAQSVGLYGVGNTTQNSSTTLDARTLSFGGRGIVTVGYSNGTIQISATEVPQTNQTVGLYGVGNTTQNSSTTLDARTISYGGRGAAIVGFSNGTVQVSVPTGTTFNGANISGSLTFDSAGLQASLSVAAPGAAAENNWMHALGANTAGNTTASGSTIGLSGVNLTISGTNNSVFNLSVPATSSLHATGAVSISTNGSTISIGAPSPGTVSFIEIADGGRFTTNAVWNNATFSRRPIFVPFQAENVLESCNTIRLFASRSTGTVLVATLFAGIYSRANSTSMNLISSTSLNISLSTSAQYSGVRMYDITGLGGLSLSEGGYVLGILASMAATNSLPLHLMGGDGMALAGFVNSGTDATAATASNSHILPFWGVFNATSGGLPSAVAASSISGGNGANSPDLYAIIKAI